MDIKRPLSSSSQSTVTAQNSESKSISRSDKATPQTGIAGAKDSFESLKQSSFQTNLATVAPSHIQLPAVQKQMTSYMRGEDSSGNVFGMMMEYQKMMNKEARQDRKIARESNQHELLSKSAKLDVESKKINEAKTEAAERYGSAMLESSLENYIGVSGKLVKGDVAKDIDAMTSRLSELKKSASEIKERLAKEAKSDGEINSVNSRYQYLISWLDGDDKP
jgi:hypothetical protein